MAITSLFLTLESWLTPHFKGIFMAFPTKLILVIFDEVLIFVKDPNNGFTTCGVVGVHYRYLKIDTITQMNTKWAPFTYLHSASSLLFCFFFFFFYTVPVNFNSQLITSLLILITISNITQLFNMYEPRNTKK